MNSPSCLHSVCVCGVKGGPVSVDVCWTSDPVRPLEVSSTMCLGLRGREREGGAGRTLTLTGNVCVFKGWGAVDYECVSSPY